MVRAVLLCALAAVAVAYTSNHGVQAVLQSSSSATQAADPPGPSLFGRIKAWLKSKSGQKTADGGSGSPPSSTDKSSSKAPTSPTSGGSTSTPTSGSGTGSGTGSVNCGPYATATLTSETGNNGVVYSVYEIDAAHKSSPGIGDKYIEKDTACAFNSLRVAAAAASKTLTINSGFRTVARQWYFRDCYCCYGLQTFPATAPRAGTSCTMAQMQRCNSGNNNCNGGSQAATPGSSNHGIGIALDLSGMSRKSPSGVTADYTYCAGLPNYPWMAANAATHGFVRTVPRECWHWEHRPGTDPPTYQTQQPGDVGTPCQKNSKGEEPPAGTCQFKADCSNWKGGGFCKGAAYCCPSA